MLNRRAILFGILCVLFAASPAFAQEESDSHIITVTKKIDVAELDEKVDDLDQSRQDLTQTLKNLDNSISNLNTNVEYLNVMVARLDERTNGMSKWQYIIIAGIFGPLLLSLYDRTKKNSENTSTSTQTTQLRQNEPIPVQIVQAGESQSTSTQTTQVRQSEASPTQPTQENVSKTNPAKASGVSRSEETPPKSQQGNSPSEEDLKEILKTDSNFRTKV